MGDWNAKIGKDAPKSQSLGENRDGETNENGKRLLNLALGQNLKIANTFENKGQKNKWTWCSPDNKTKHEIDHFLITDLRIVNKYELLNRVMFSSDHIPSRAWADPRGFWGLNLPKFGNFLLNHTLKDTKISLLGTYS